MKYIVWENYETEGWEPNYYDTLKEAIEHKSNGCETKITKEVEYEIKDVEEK